MALSARIRWSVVVLAVAVAAAACSRGPSDTEKGSGEAPSTSAGGGGAGDFGTLGSVCRPGRAKGVPAARGVTAGSITVGTFADPGARVRPGLNQELFDTAEVFAAWCNDHGGINGRKIVLDEHDAALISVRPEMAKACERDFFLVGGGAVLDQDGVRPRLTCMLPEITGFAVSPEARTADLQVQALPNGMASVPATTTGS